MPVICTQILEQHTYKIELPYTFLLQEKIMVLRGHKNVQMSFFVQLITYVQIKAPQNSCKIKIVTFKNELKIAFKKLT